MRAEMAVNLERNCVAHCGDSSISSPQPHEGILSHCVHEPRDQQVTRGVEVWDCREDPGSLWGMLGLWPAISKRRSPRFQSPSNSPASVASLLPAL